MIDNITAIERLQKLKESGALNEDEFQTEKQLILRPVSVSTARMDSIRANAAHSSGIETMSTFRSSRIGFIESIKTCFSNYASFSGRASRPEFWYFMLFCVVGGAIIDTAFGRTGLSLIFDFVIALPQISVATRRLHDVGRSGWWQLLSLTIIGVIPLLYWWAIAGDEQSNRFGVAPNRQFQ